MAKQITFCILKIALLYLLFPFIRVDLVLFAMAIPGHIFEYQPFLMAAGFVVTVAVAASFTFKSRSPVLWALFSIAFSGVFIIFFRESLLLIAICLVIGATSFLYRNKITEPFLVLLPIIAGAWLFLQVVYKFCLILWAYYWVGQESLNDSLLNATPNIKNQASHIALIIPLIVMYLLGKQSYVKLIPIFQSLIKRKELNDKLN